MTQNVRVGTGYISINIDRTGLQRSLREAQRDVDSWVSGVNRSIQNGLSNSFRNGMQNAQRSMQSSLQQTQQSINSSMSGSQQSISGSLQGGFKSGFSGVAGLAGGARSAITGLMGGMASLITGGLKTAFVGGFAGVAGLAVSAVSSIKGAITGVGSFITSTLSTAFNAGFQVAKVGAVAAGTAIVGAIADGTNKAATFEQKMKDVQATMNATNEEAASLKDLAMDLALSDKLNVSADQAAQAIEILALNGVKAQDMIDGMAEKTVALANATGNDFKTSADLMTDVMAQFKLGVEDAGMVIDGLTGITTNSKIDIQNAMYAFANGGQAAADAGMSFEDFSTTLAGIASSFSSGQTAATSFSTLIGRMSHPVGDAKKAMEELDLSMFDAAGNMKPMEQIITELRASLDGLTQQEVARLSKMLGGDDAKKAVGALAGLTAEKFLELKDAVNATGQAQQSAATRTDTFLGAWNILNSAIESTRIAIGDEFLPIFTEMIRDFTGFYKSHAPQVIAFFGKIADGVEVTYRQLKYLFTPITDQSGEALSVFDNLAIKVKSFSPLLSSIIQTIGSLVDAFFGARDSVMDAWGDGGVFGMFESFTGFDVTGALGLDNIPAIAKDVAKQAGNALDTVGSKVKQSVGNMTGGVIGGPAVEAGPSQQSAIKQAESGYTGEQVKKAIELLELSGMKMADIVNGFASSTAILANETGGNMQDAADVMTDIFNQFDIGAGESTQAVATLKDVMDATGYSLEDMSDIIANSGSAASDSGMEFSEFANTIAGMSGEFDNATEAGKSVKKKFIDGFSDPENNEAALSFIDDLTKSGESKMAEFRKTMQSGLQFNTSEVDVGFDYLEQSMSTYLSHVIQSGDLSNKYFQEIPESHREMALELGKSYQEMGKLTFTAGKEEREAYRARYQQAKSDVDGLLKETTSKAKISVDQLKDIFSYYAKSAKDDAGGDNLAHIPEQYQDVALQIGKAIEDGTMSANEAWEQFALKSGIATKQVQGNITDLQRSAGGLGGGGIMGNLQAAVKGTMNRDIKGPGKAAVEKAKETSKAFVQNIAAGINEDKSMVAGSFGGLVDSAKGIFKELFSLPFDLYKAFQTSGVSGVIEELFSSGRSVLGDVIKLFAQLIGLIGGGTEDNWLFDLFNNIGNFVKGTGDASAIFDSMAEGARWLYETVKGYIIDITETFLGAGAADRVQELFGTVEFFIGALVTRFQELTAAASEGGIEGFILNLFGEGALEQFNAFREMINNLIVDIQTVVDLILQRMTELDEAFQEGGLVGMLTKAFGTGADAGGILTTSVLEMLPVLIGAFGQLFNGLKDAIYGEGGAIDSLVMVFRSFPERLVAWVLSPEAEEAFANIGRAIADFIVSSFSHNIENGEQYNTVLTRLGQLLLEGVAAIAFAFVAIGAQIVANIALGIIEGITGEEGAGAMTMSEFTKIMTGVAEMIKTYGWMEVGSEVLRQIIAGITNIGEDVMGSLTNLGVQMGQGVMDGITSMTDTSAISDWVYGMVGEAESAAQIQSPSKLFENRFGRPIGQGAIRGFEAEAVGGVSSVVGGMVNAMPNLSSLVPQPQPIPAGTFGGGDNYSFSNTINAAAGMNEEGVARKVEQKVIKSMKTLQKFRRRNG